MLPVILVVSICSGFPGVAEAEPVGGAANVRVNQKVTSPSGAKPTPGVSEAQERKEKKAKKGEKENSEEKKEEAK